MNCLVTKKVNGVEITQFQPTSSMRLFALSALCDPKMIGRDPEEICASIGLGKKTYANFLKFEPWWSEWIEDFRLAVGGKNRRALLEAVGMEESLKGNFNFWKAMSIKEGVISPDQLSIGVNLPSSLGAFQGMSDAEISATENSIMAALCGEANPTEIAMVKGNSGWEPESDPHRASEVPEERVVLAPELGDDREFCFDEIESF